MTYYFPLPFLSPSFLAIPVIITVADRKTIRYSDERKVHRNPIPSLGGLGILQVFIIACNSSPFSGSWRLVLFRSLFCHLFLGLKDDILVLAYKNSLARYWPLSDSLQGNVQISGMHGFLGIYELPEMFSLLFTYLTIIVIVNSFNLIDGIDGLAGSLGLMATTVFGLYFLAAVQMPGYANYRSHWPAALTHSCYSIFNQPKYSWAIPVPCLLVLVMPYW